MIGLLLWAAATAAPGPAAPAKVEALGWLNGHWRTASGPAWTEEIWSSAEGGMMLGLSRTHGSSGIRSWEFMRIAAGGGEGAVSFHGSPNGAPPVAFKLVRASPSEAVFENPAHDFPQRIAYRLEGEELVATVSLIDGAKAISWRFRRHAP